MDQASSRPRRDLPAHRFRWPLAIPHLHSPRPPRLGPGPRLRPDRRLLRRAGTAGLGRYRRSGRAVFRGGQLGHAVRLFHGPVPGRRRLSARLDRGQRARTTPIWCWAISVLAAPAHPGIRLGRQRDAGPLAGRRPGLRTRRRRAGAGDGAVAAPDRGLRDDDADVRAFPGTILAAPAVPGQRAGNHHARGHRRAGHDGRRAGPSGRAGRATPDA